MEEDISKLITLLCNAKHLYVIPQSTAKGALVCLTACGVTGVVGGPLGVAAGAAVGGVLWYWTISQSRPLVDLLKQFSPAQIAQLCRKVAESVCDLIRVGVELIEAVMTCAEKMEKVINVIKDFLNHELKMNLASIPPSAGWMKAITYY